MSIIYNFLWSLPGAVGRNFRFALVYDRLLDADHNGSLQHQEIYDYVQKNRAMLMRWYDPPKGKRPSYIKSLEQELYQDLKKQIPIPELIESSPRMTDLKNKLEELRKENEKQSEALKKEINERLDKLQKELNDKLQKELDKKFPSKAP
jgi:hypothetical protein